ncbi:hypothetical protein CQW23_19965 [Capsicum baccatum]|uniref:Uncharacterized protein n=1 Tax=Capsicum baccatum TaxID=33114 RepID=A0A2G2W797_CAPBA|nr:hypothetical protein CQW23_19965 [Capsicum baccatum]
MKSWKDDMTDSSDEFVNNYITDAEEFSPMIEQQDCGISKIEDELSYVTAYNECGDVFIVDIYGGMDMSLKHSECINLGHKKSCRVLEENPVVNNSTVSCSVLPCLNRGDDMVVIYTIERMYLCHLIGQRVETVMIPGQLNPARRFIA